jgi:sacsin
LIQNADDAGASMISFILDTRTHGLEKIFSNQFSALQGPALCCYNDRPFTDDDLNALKTLGVGNKKDDKFKIGSHGVGFNTVYRTTDAPQLISDLKNWVIFDPLCKHLIPDLMSSNGYRINFDISNPNDSINHYSDVIQSFTGYFDNMQQLTNGTMLRLAFRTENSEISDLIFTPDIIESDFKKMKRT